ncbi:hypothetical protein [Sulfitobacter sp. JB4-11]|uniref:hypothetical protein n=1 Tax=Sulfitobacter rhodophyticola TaxID=3238304 RepID=UPI003511CA7F
MQRLSLSAFLILAVGACTQFPELDRTVTPELATADFPALVPLDPILANAQVAQSANRQTEAVLEARVANLRARAARLRGSVLTGRERQRLAEGLR